MKKLWLIIFSAITFAPDFALAHAFGQKYTLPIPAWMYVYGGGATIIISFLLIGYFTTEDRHQKIESTINLSKKQPFKVLISKGFIRILKTISLVLFALTILAGLFGIQRASDNFAPTFFWIVFLLGFTYLVAIVGNIWSVVNPWKLITTWVMDFKPTYAYPSRLGYWPALIFYFFLIWLELLSGGAGVRPVRLGIYLLIYVIISLVGAMLYGVSNWFRYGDFFSVYFKLIGKVSPFEYRDGQLHLRWPFIGLLKGQAESFTLLLFIVFTLASTAFDGFRETVKGGLVSLSLSFLPTYQARQIIILIGATLIFLAVYLIAVALIKVLVKTELSVTQLALKFAYSLVPIALAYNVAHYFTLLLVQGQSFITQISDPLNRGWNLLGTAGYETDVAIIGAKEIWYTQIIVILIGHIAAVYIAHVVALRIFNSHKKAVVSQLPMLVVMVIYTMVGLWILAQAISLS